MFLRTVSALLLPLMLFALGCGGGDGPVLAPVSGTVTYQGKPLEKGEITFHPAAGRPANGQIEGGKIVGVTTLDRNDGVTVGSCKVAIVSVERSPDIHVPSKPLIPLRYGNVQQSGLTADIKPGQTNEVSFALTE